MKLDHITVQQLASTALITVRVDATLHTAHAQMKLADVRHLPVVTEDGRLVGMLSNRDVLAALGESKGKGVPISEIMSTDVVFVRPDTRAAEATALMLDKKIGALPILGRDGTLVGIVTETDFLRVAHRLLGGDRLAVDE